MAFAPPFSRVFSPTFDRRAAVAAGNGLLNALIAYWPGNEASGDLLDLHSNALHLTDTNTVTNAAGKVYATARQYASLNSEYHIRPGDDALLSSGDVDFTLAAWCYIDASTGFNQQIACKWNTSTAQREYNIYYSNASQKLSFAVSDDGTFKAAAIAEWSATAPTGQWYFVAGWHDSVANVTAITVNNGTPITTSWTAGALNGTAAFSVGSAAGAGATYFNGRIGPVAFWKSAAGGGGVLTATQRTALWNAGNGLAYAQFTT